MKFEQPPTSPTPEKKSLNKEFEEKAKIIEDLDIGEEKLKAIDQRRRELDKKYESASNQEEREKIKKEHEQLSEQAKEIDEKISGSGKEESEEEKPEKKEGPKEEKLNLLERYDKYMEPISDNVFTCLWEVISSRLWGGDPEDPMFLLMQNELKLSRETPVWVKEETKGKEPSSAKAMEGKQEEPKERKEGKEKVPPEEKIKEQLKEKGALSVMEKILQDPEVLSEILSEASEILKNPEVQERFQELKDAIEKITKEKKETPAAVKDAKDFIKKEMGEKKEGGKEKKESPWKTAFGVVGWGILLFLVLFMLAELKGVDYLSGQAAGKKKEKK